jgi:beta-N-acetylhexosaminidase
MRIFKTALLLFIGPLVSFGQAQVTDSLDIKIGQMILVGMAGSQVADNQVLADIRSGKTGGIILFEKNINPKNSFLNLKKLTWELQKAAQIPLFIAIDQEGGQVNRLKEKYGFPRTVTAAHLGNSAPEDSTRFYAQITATTLAGLGINVNFAPVVDLATNPNNPIIARYGRAYSADAASTTAHAREVIRAQSRHGVVSVLKHFPGHGSSLADTHLGIADVTNYWQEAEVLPYRQLIQSGDVQAIMSAHIVNKNLDKDGHPGTLSKAILTDWLRGEMGFQGVIFSDDMQMHAITKYYGLEKSIQMAIEAGVDVMIFSNNIQGSKDRTVHTVHGIIRSLVEKGKISPERIDESFQRIMHLKQSTL